MYCNLFLIDIKTSLAAKLGGTEVEGLLRDIARRLGVTIYDLGVHRFEPVGYTGIAIIGSSHLAVHTYPEEGMVRLDIFCHEPESRLVKIKEFLREKLKSTCTSSRVVRR